MSNKITPNGTSAVRKNTAQKTNGFVRFLKFIFVKNFELKLLALLTSALMWALIVGLG